MLTTIPYSDAAGINNVEWDAVGYIEFCFKVAKQMSNFGHAVNDTSYWSYGLQKLDWLTGTAAT